MQSDYQIPLVVTFMFVIFPIVSFIAMLCYRTMAFKKIAQREVQDRRD